MISLKSIVVICATAACSLAITGCNAVHDEVSVAALYDSMKKDLGKESRNVEKLDISRPFTLEDFPVLKEVCENMFDKPDYKYDGVMMRIKINKDAYKLDGGMMYRHQYGLCFDFYPVAEGQKQEAVFVSCAIV